MIFELAVRRLEQALGAMLPGEAAQELMAPRPPREWPPGFNPARVRHAAGLLLVYPIDRQAHIVLTVRADTLGRHQGQVSLPGGAVDPGESFEEAALREAHEEVGLTRDGVRPLGRITPVDIPVSGFRLHPVVAETAAHPSLRPADLEVARILEVDLERLMRPDALAETKLVREGVALHAPAFLLDGIAVWGATAMVLAEFLTMLGWSRRTSP